MVCAKQSAKFNACSRDVRCKLLRDVSEIHSVSAPSERPQIPLWPKFLQCKCFNWQNWISHKCVSLARLTGLHSFKVTSVQVHFGVNWISKFNGSQCVCVCLNALRVKLVENLIHQMADMAEEEIKLKRPREEIIKYNLLVAPLMWRLCQPSRRICQAVIITSWVGKCVFRSAWFQAEGFLGKGAGWNRTGVTAGRPVFLVYSASNMQLSN